MPAVEAASFHSFQEIQSLIWKEGVNQRESSMGIASLSGSVEIVFHEEIGAHNITVVKAGDTLNLID